jgi:putative ABC transport system permease protein
MRAYRLLLRAYPASFRAEYGEEMAAIFHQRLRDADGPFGRLLLWASVAGEALMTALAVHWDILRQDLRYTVRTLSRARAFALTAMAIVALGIGANTAAFSLTDFVLFRPLPFRAPDRLVTIWQQSPGYARMELSPPNIRDWKAAATSFESLGTYKNYAASMLGVGEPQRVTGAMISGDLFPTLGVTPALGRSVIAGDGKGRSESAVILSDRLWRAAFGGDPGVLGRKLVLDERVYEVVGVMPRGFSFPSRDAELWVPIEFDDEDYESRTNNEVYAVARLKPEATLASARAELQVLAGQSAIRFPKENATTTATVTDLRDELSRESRTMVLALSGAALCVLLIVCANLANLLLARALGRRQELAVRAAMGAGRERLIRQLATESVVLAAVGGAIGVLLAAALVPLLWQLVPPSLPTDAIPGIDVRVLAFAGVLTLITTLAFGLAPIMRTGADVHAGGLREGARALGGRKERLRGVLVIGEVVASVVLLVCTGLLVRALWTVQERDPGFRTEGVLTLRTDIPGKYAVTARRAEMYDQILGKIRALPGVTGAAFISGLPMVWGGGIWPVGINGAEVERRSSNSASMRFTTPGFLRAMQIPLLRGREVAETDTEKSQYVAVVSESLVKRYWPGQDGINKTFEFAGRSRTIVGVVADIRVRGLERDSEPQVYLPYRQQPDGGLWGYTPKHLVIRSSGALAQLGPAIRDIVQSVDRDLPIYGMRPMSEIVELQTASRSVQVRVLAGFTLVAFLLAAIGIHGVLSFSVTQRTPEIGVRIALGAQRSDILRMVMRRGLLLVASGLLPGLLLAYLAGRSLQALLVGVTPADPATYAAALGLTMTMAFAGTLLPTLRALRIDPLRAIRAE